MFTFILVMALGAIMGYLLRHQSKVQKVHALIHATVRVLLFLLGLSIGLNKLIVDNLSYFCGQAAVISTLSVLGSLIASFILYKMYFQKRIQS